MATRRCDQCGKVVTSRLPVVPGVTVACYTCYQCLEDQVDAELYNPVTGGLLPSPRVPRPEKRDA